jgi:hypothetical protein
MRPASGRSRGDGDGADERVIVVEIYPPPLRCSGLGVFWAAAIFILFWSDRVLAESRAADR